MRTILSFMRQNSLSCKLGLRMRLIGSPGLLAVAAAIFASSGKTRIAHTPPLPMPGLRGEAAAEYLKHQGLHIFQGGVQAVRGATANTVRAGCQ